jgi:steroid delta-isomerase-like uncharacterized protein
MSTERNKQLVARLYDELINQEKHEILSDIFAPAVVIHDPFSGVLHGIEGFRQLLGLFDAAFPHHRVQVEAMIAEGDFVTVLHTHTATHQGPFMGLPPTGKTIVVNGLELFRMAEGRVVEFWRKDDDASMLMQLGILPTP